MSDEKSNIFNGTCGECRHLDRCQALIGPDSIKPENDWCDFGPSRWQPSAEVVKLGLAAHRGGSKGEPSPEEDFERAAARLLGLLFDINPESLSDERFELKRALEKQPEMVRQREGD